jgi:hypothetical protein
VAREQFVKVTRIILEEFLEKCVTEDFLFTDNNLIHLRFFYLRLQPKNLKIEVHKTTLLPVLYGCGIWTHTLRKYHVSSDIENHVLRRKFIPNRE